MQFLPCSDIMGNLIYVANYVYEKTQKKQVWNNAAIKNLFMNLTAVP